MSLSNEAELMPTTSSLAWSPIDPSAARFLRVDRSERKPSRSVDLSHVWQKLITHQEVVMDGWFGGASCSILLAPEQDARVPLDGRRLSVLEACLRGIGQKRIAIDLDLAPSTVALQARVALECMGVRTRPSRVHPLLMLAASAGAHDAVRIPAVETPLEQGGQEWRVITVPRPDIVIRGLVSPAEAEVVARLVEGRCYADISRERGTSPRTTANQIAGAFRRLRVSGRSELVQRLFVLSGWLRASLD